MAGGDRRGLRTVRDRLVELAVPARHSPRSAAPVGTGHGRALARAVGGLGCRIRTGEANRGPALGAPGDPRLAVCREPRRCGHRAGRRRCHPGRYLRRAGRARVRYRHLQRRDERGRGRDRTLPAAGNHAVVPRHVQSRRRPRRRSRGRRHRTARGGIPAPSRRRGCHGGGDRTGRPPHPGLGLAAAPPRRRPDLASARGHPRRLAGPPYRADRSAGAGHVLRQRRRERLDIAGDGHRTPRLARDRRPDVLGVRRRHHGDPPARYLRATAAGPRGCPAWLGVVRHGGHRMLHHGAGTRCRGRRRGLVGPRLGARLPDRHVRGG